MPGTPRLGPPIARPGKIICLGRNYAAHARETDAPVPSEPIYFVKASTAVIGQDDEIVYPEGAERVDPEAELAVVIGTRARNLTRESALDCVLGYTILNDVTERSLQQQDIAARQPWFRSKSYDTFCPMGPVVVLTDEISDPHTLQITLRVNGELRQTASTAEMIFKIPDILVAITRHITLEPGDIVSTGTPQGIAPIKPGDLVECTVTGIGTLRNRVVSSTGTP
ncbi:MAG: fumarylacetoacetate hydrolase family protein [Limnochordales bacterium]|nr:fumarylacetoacetate hydrolase family protein [Limnochordales bacterium]